MKNAIKARIKQLEQEIENENENTELEKVMLFHNVTSYQPKKPLLFMESMEKIRVCKAELNALRFALKENKIRIEKYCEIKEPTSFDLFRLFSDLTGLNIEELKQNLKGEE